MFIKTKLKLFFGLILTAVIIYFSIRSLGRLHPGKVFRFDINWSLAAVSIVVFMYANYIRGLAYTRGMDRNIDRLTAFQIVGIGHAANMILPLHAGEGLRLAFFPSDYSAMRRTKILIIQAIADVVVILMISLLAVPFAGFKDPNLLKALWILSILCISVGILLSAVIVLVPRLRNYAKGYLDIDIVKMMFWIILSWILLLMSTWIGLIAFGFHAAESMRMSLAVFAATNIINFIPATPGAIGLFEYGVIIGLGWLGINQMTALSAGLLLHLIQYAALLPMGGALYIKAIHGKYGEALREMQHKSPQKVTILKK